VNRAPQYTFEWLVRNNIMDCHMHVSPRDKLWFGNFIYRDRTMNKKWNIVRKEKYKGKTHAE
jgi:diadenosine tetraphosphate (Ap4A) HIT family hydrolase